mmetsp:Transcript_13284/g.23818  ORF Transcript_13284/g.23818 Transcript_13284/m.23818 type:complete len:336 (-) Transcript_13284:1143-2150(-)
MPDSSANAACSRGSMCCWQRGGAHAVGVKRHCPRPGGAQAKQAGATHALVRQAEEHQDDEGDPKGCSEGDEQRKVPLPDPVRRACGVSRSTPGSEVCGCEAPTAWEALWGCRDPRLILHEDDGHAHLVVPLDVAVQQPRPWVVGDEAEVDPGVREGRQRVLHWRVIQVQRVAAVVVPQPGPQQPELVAVQVPGVLLGYPGLGWAILQDHIHNFALGNAVHVGRLPGQVLGQGPHVGLHEERGGGPPQHGVVHGPPQVLLLPRALLHDLLGLEVVRRAGGAILVVVGLGHDPLERQVRCLRDRPCAGDLPWRGHCSELALQEVVQVTKDGRAVGVH